MGNEKVRKARQQGLNIHMIALCFAAYMLISILSHKDFMENGERTGT